MCCGRPYITLYVYVIPDDSLRKVPEASSTLNDLVELPISTATDTIFSTHAAISSSAVTPITSADVLVSSSGSENILSVIDRNMLPSSTSTSTVIQVPSTASTISELPTYPLSTANCAQCKIIEQELSQHVSKPNTSAIPRDLSTKSSTSPIVKSPRTPPRPDRNRHENVWQVDTTADEYRPTLLSKRLPLSPIESVQESSTSTKSSSDIDSTSFIILRDDVDTSKEMLGTANLSINGKSISTTAQSSMTVPSSAVPKSILMNSEVINSENSNRTTLTTTTPSISAPSTTAPSDRPASPSSATADDSLNSKERCNDCCFCNPNLHRRDGAISAESCSYCNQQRQSARPIPPPPKTQETRSTNTTHFYETLSKTDHTHVRTRSKDSDTVSLKCTRTNSKVRRFIPDDTVSGVDDLTATPSVATVKEKKSQWSRNASSHENATPQKPPKVPASSPTKKSRSVLEDSKTSKKIGGQVRLPSPFMGVVSSSQSYDSSSSCSSSSSSPSNPSKKCPVLPVARWQNQTSGGRTVHAAKPRASRYQNFYGNNGTVADDGVAVNGASNIASVAAKGVADGSTTSNQTSGNYIQYSNCTQHKSINPNSHSPSDTNTKYTL